MGRKVGTEWAETIKFDPSEMNHETIVDTYLPHVERLREKGETVYPQDILDIMELQEKYEKLCQKKIGASEAEER